MLSSDNKAVFGMVESGIANTGSVRRAFQRLGVEVSLLSHGRDVGSVDAIVLPGVGSFADGMNSLREKGFIDPLKQHAIDGKPIIGLCLGMQLLADFSEENGAHEGLGIVGGQVKKLCPAENERVPNIGWCDLKPNAGSRLFRGIASGESIYFVHSYHLVCKDPEVNAATISFGGAKVTAAIEQKNIFGLQGHPEKSQDVGLRVLHNFVCLAGKGMTA